MSSLRALGVGYLATASFFVVAIACADRAALNLVAGNAARALNDRFQARLVEPLIAFAQAQDEKFFDPPTRAIVSLAPSGLDAPRAALPRRVLAARPLTPPLAPPLPPEMLEIAPDLPVMAAPAARAVSALPPGGPPGLSGETGITPAQRAAVTARMAQALTPALLHNFDLFLYVSKADSGPLAQRLYVFRKDSTGALTLIHDWAASTGREQAEISPRGARTITATPPGFYQLDPDRLFRHYRSYAWDQPMPHAMFFNWESQGRQTGLAIHAAGSARDIALLGRRASAGCVHLSPAHARQLFDMIRADYRGPVPRFAYDGAHEERGRTMRRDGEMMRDAQGRLVMADGYRVLIDIEDFGGSPVVAALGDRAAPSGMAREEP